MTRRSSSAGPTRGHRRRFRVGHTGGVADSAGRVTWRLREDAAGAPPSVGRGAGGYPDRRLGRRHRRPLEPRSSAQRRRRVGYTRVDPAVVVEPDRLPLHAQHPAPPIGLGVGLAVLGEHVRIGCRRRVEQLPERLAPRPRLFEAAGDAPEHGRPLRVQLGADRGVVALGAFGRHPRPRYGQGQRLRQRDAPRREVVSMTAERVAILRADDQRAGRSPTHCVRTGVPTTGAVRIRSIAFERADPLQLVVGDLVASLLALLLRRRGPVVVIAVSTTGVAAMATGARRPGRRRGRRRRARRRRRRGRCRTRGGGRRAARRRRRRAPGARRAPVVDRRAVPPGTRRDRRVAGLGGVRRRRPRALRGGARCGADVAAARSVPRSTNDVDLKEG